VAEEEQEEQGEDEQIQAPPPAGSRVNQFVVLVIIVLIGQVALAYMLIDKIVLPKQRVADAEESGEVLPESVESEAEKKIVKTPLLHPLEEILLNPRDEAGIRFLRVKISLEVDNEEVLGVLQESMVKTAQIRELLARTMNNMPFHMLDGPEDRMKLRETLKGIVNESGLLETGEVRAVYFELFILQ
jgi:flagellar basal body-associated protein FliL